MKPEHLGLDASGMPDGLNAENHPGGLGELTPQCGGHGNPLPTGYICVYTCQTLEEYLCPIEGGM